MQHHFHNTIGYQGAVLEAREVKAMTQDAVILAFFRRNAGRLFTPYQVHEQNPGLAAAPITSIRRAITNLTKEGKLVKANLRLTEKFGEKNHTWYYPACDDKGQMLLTL